MITENNGSQVGIPLSEKEVTDLLAANGEPETRPAILERLLRMGDDFLRDRAVRQAMELYWTLVDQHKDSREAALARTRLMKIAETCERAGETRQARSIYERLL